MRDTKKQRSTIIVIIVSLSRSKLYSFGLSNLEEQRVGGMVGGRWWGRAARAAAGVRAVVSSEFRSIEEY